MTTETQSDQKTAAAVDEAWRQFKQARTPQAEVVYDRALEAWKSSGANRPVGRPRGGDQSLGSSARATAARARQKESATKWDKVAPLIQQLRRAVDMNNGPAITRIAATLVQATRLAVKDLRIVHVRPDRDVVGLAGVHDKQPILGLIAKAHLEDHFRRRMTAKQANQLVDRNIEEFGRIIAVKYERGDCHSTARAGVVVPCVEIVLADIEASGEMMSER